ncbi:tyrosine-protein phosphatase non-receptor type 13-like [Tubulanus polymorphus]|uniref:tyrosine-protein phosphatase non-receptor type 13-like n=1 Tax=Tubulanus polymorphus TaxID=672921 RepID=UPI003DA34E0E
MPGLDLQVSLAEALEVRVVPITEGELWAVLCQTAETIQDFVEQDEAFRDGKPTYVVTPDTLMLCSDGHVELADVSVDHYIKSSYMAPEIHEKHHSSSHYIEKMYVYSLGMTLYSAADVNSTNKDAKISHVLDSLLYSMCEEQAVHRPSLADLLHECRNQGPRFTGQMPYPGLIIQLYQQIMGSSHNLDQVEKSFHYPDRIPTPRSVQTTPRHSRSRTPPARDKLPPRSRSHGRGAYSNAKHNSLDSSFDSANRGGNLPHHSRPFGRVGARALQPPGVETSRW